MSVLFGFGEPACCETKNENAEAGDVMDVERANAAAGEHIRTCCGACAYNHASPTADAVEPRSSDCIDAAATDGAPTAVCSCAVPYLTLQKGPSVGDVADTLSPSPLAFGDISYVRSSVGRGPHNSAVHQGARTPAAGGWRAPLLL